MTDLDFSSFLQKQFILLGEMHGVRENIEILKMFIEWATQLEEPVVVCLEWPDQLTEEINDYLLGVGLLRWSSWEFIKHKDGRVSQEHIAFLEWLKDFNLHLVKKTTVQCFDVETGGWNERDKKMANILLKRKSERVRVIAIMGNFHAKKEKFFLDQEEHIPLGYYLPTASTTTIKLDYLSGSFFNKSQKEFINRETNDDTELLLKESQDPDYDFVLLIPRAHPVSLLK